MQVGEGRTKLITVTTILLILRLQVPPFPRPMDFQGLMDFLGLKEARQGLSSWIRVDTYGDSQTNYFSKLTVMRRCHLASRDLRLIDPQCVYPPTILGREKAIVVNLEQIRCIITADEVLLVNSLDSSVSQFVVELQRRLTTVEGGGGGQAGGSS